MHCPTNLPITSDTYSLPFPMPIPFGVYKHEAFLRHKSEMNVSGGVSLCQSSCLRAIGNGRNSALKQLFKPQIALNIGDNPPNAIIFRQTLWQPPRYSLLIVSPHALTTLVGWGIRLILNNIHIKSCTLALYRNIARHKVTWRQQSIWSTLSFLITDYSFL